MIYTAWQSTHRMKECFGLEETFKDHLVQPSGHGQGHFSLGQVAQSPIQPDFEHFQGWGIHNISGQPVPVSHPRHKKIPPYVQSTSTLFQFKTVAPCPVTKGLGKKSLSIFLRSHLYVLNGCKKVSPDPSLLQAEQLQISQPFFIGEVFHPSDHFCGLHLDLL